jgi:hypothetical protein
MEQTAEDKSGGAREGISGILRRPSTRLLLLTTTLTTAVLALAGGVVYHKQTAERARLEGLYSRMVAHFAEEADLRIGSYLEIARVVGNAHVGLVDFANVVQLSEFAKDAVESAKKARDVARQDLKKLGAAKDNKKDAAINAMDASDTATQKASEAKDTFDLAATDAEAEQKRLEDLERREREHQQRELEKTQVDQNDTGTSGGTTEPQNPAPSAAINAAPPPENAKSAGALRAQISKGVMGPAQASAGSPDLTIAGPANDILQQKRKVEEARGKKAKAEEAAARAAKEASKTISSESEALAAYIQALGSEIDAMQRSAVSDEQRTEAIQKLQKDLKAVQIDVEEVKRLSFLPAPAECQRTNHGAAETDARCVAQTLARTLLKGTRVQDLPEVTQCPKGIADDDLREPAVLLMGRWAMFAIPARKVETDAPTAAPSPGNSSRQVLCLRVPVEALVPFGESGASDRDGRGQSFNEILLVDKTSGRVLEWSGTDPQVRATTLDTCGGTEPHCLGKAGDSPEPEASATAPAKPTRSLVAAALEVAGEGYQSFRQPIRTKAEVCSPDPVLDGRPACADGTGLVVVGLVREARLIEQVRGLSPIMFLWAVVLASLAVFSWPVAKVWLVGARSRFSRFDSAFLTTSALAGTFIATVLALTLLARETLTHRLDRQLESATAEIGKTLNVVLKDASDGLQKFVERTGPLRRELDAVGAAPMSVYTIENGLTKACFDAAADRHLTVWPHPEDPDHRWPVCELQAATRPATNGARFHEDAPAFFWVNRQGYEQIEMHERGSGTPPVNVAARHYFQRAEQACRLGPDDAPKTASTPEVVRSLTSTQKVLIVARPTECTKGKDGEGTYGGGVAGFEADLSPFEHFSLPPGTQWAAIDASGSVMLHSNIDDHHGHDFFDDVDDATAERLRTAMLGRSAESFEGEYRGIRSRIRIAPNPESGWYLVALASHGLDDGVIRNTVVAATAGFVGFATLVALVIVLLALARMWTAPTEKSRRRVRVLDLRPHADASPDYAKAVLWMGGASLALLGASLAFGHELPTWFLLALSAALIGSAAWLVPGIWPAREAAQSSPRHWPEPPVERTLVNKLALTYPLCCFVLAAATVVVPTTICFVASFYAAAQNGLRIEQRAELPPPRCSAPCPDEKNTKKESLGPACPKFVTGMEPECQPIGPPADAQAAASGGLWPLPPLLKWLRPDVMADRERSGAGGNEHASYEWRQKASTLYLSFTDPNKPAWALRSEIPHLVFHTDWSHVVPGGIAFLVLLLAAHGLAFASLKRLFFMDVLLERQDARAPKDLPNLDGPLDKKWTPLLLLFPPPERIRSLRDDNPGTVVLERDAPGAGSREAATAKLVLAEFDPFRSPSADERDRWSEALKDFVVFRGPGRGMRDDTSPSPVPNAGAFALEWSRSDPDEQRVLTQLAYDGYASPHPNNGPVLRHLAARGLVDDRTLALHDPAFAKYLQQTVSLDTLDAWQAREINVAWNIVRMPLVASVGLVVLLVAMSHPELAEGGALLLPPVAGGLPAVLRFVATLLGKSREEAV